jgi:hypothetical protein
LFHDDEATCCEQDIRLLAAVVAKNSVGSSWRKTLGTREWARVPAEEKANVRGCLLQMLLSDPNRRVAVQLALLITNIARFDFPTPWYGFSGQSALLCSVLNIWGPSFSHSLSISWLPSWWLKSEKYVELLILRQEGEMEVTQT